MTNELTTLENSPQKLIELALSKGADAETLERLFALQERWEANQARKAFVEAVAAFKASPPKITKDRHVEHNDFWHATLEHIVAVAAPALATHGLSHRWETEHSESGQITVVCVLTHTAGHSERNKLSAKPDTTGGKNSIQAVGSTVTYLQRYTFMAITGLAATGADDDAASVTAAPRERVSEKQVEVLMQWIDSQEADVDAFLRRVSKAARMDVTSVEEVPADLFDMIVDAFKRQAEKR